MGSENKATCVYNMLHNLQGLGPSPPTFGANNMMVVLWVITPTLPPTNLQSGHAGDQPGFTTHEQAMNGKLLLQNLIKWLHTLGNWNPPR